ncbi:hypothetical protein L211DRAFT_309410 [Terfezia boudieri ATCC MYA-4762]|uniref:Serine/threonine-protein kinase BSK1-like TPR repeats domain-containing protein n=1 Tax=Terfezia boudieri ATCC MYA-4762 TaxID=1051890 RepID=A0A3N4LMJ6_9PEZI|nr:hypothetical protein L211DRAFT_309410 [Terfezia boudieri ATCC MYA-4762]
MSPKGGPHIFAPISTCPSTSITASLSQNSRAFQPDFLRFYSNKHLLTSFLSPYCASTNMADQLKAEGNAAFAKKDFNKAIECFTKAIELDASNHVLYSNRSACYASQKNFDKALEDAEKTTRMFCF